MIPTLILHLTKSNFYPTKWWGIFFTNQLHYGTFSDILRRTKKGEFIMVRPRSVALCIVLSIVTCGIYGLYWIACLNDDINEVTGNSGTSGLMVVLFSFITCGIYFIYWGYKMGDILDRNRIQYKIPTGSLPIVFLLLNLFGLGIVSLALMQNEVNHYSPTV